MTLPTGPGWPDLDAYKQWARVPDGADDIAIDQSLTAVKEAVVARCPVLATPACPSDAFYAVLLWTNRLMTRRQSPEAIVGVPDLGVIGLAAQDRDIAQLLSPWFDQVIA